MKVWTVVILNECEDKSLALLKSHFEKVWMSLEETNPSGWGPSIQ